MAVRLEWILGRPDLADYFEPGIIAMRMNDDQPAARRQRSGQWRQYALGFELDRGAGTVWLRGNDEIIIGERRAASRPHLVEQKFVVVTVEHEDDRPVINRIAASQADPRAPMFRQKGLQIGDLLF